MKEDYSRRIFISDNEAGECRSTHSRPYIPDFCIFYALQNDDWMVVGMIDEQLLKVEGTRRQDHLVAADGRVVAREGHVAEGLNLKVKHMGNVRNPSAVSTWHSKSSPAASCPRHSVGCSCGCSTEDKTPGTRGPSWISSAVATSWNKNDFAHESRGLIRLALGFHLILFEITITVQRFSF